MTGIIVISISILAVLGLIEVRSRLNWGLPALKSRGLSRPAKRLCAAFKNLPKDSRPAIDIVGVVKALDIKHGTDDANLHYRHYSYTTQRVTFRWSVPRCGHGENATKHCDICKDYLVLRNAMVGIEDELDKQRYTLKLMKAQGGLDDAQDLVARLRDERETLAYTNKYLGLK